MATPAQRRIAARKRREEQQKRAAENKKKTTAQSTPKTKTKKNVRGSGAKNKTAQNKPSDKVNKALANTAKNAAKGVVDAPGRLLRNTLRVNEGVQQLKEGKRGEAVNAESRPIGSGRKSDNKVWAGENYGYQSKGSFDQLKDQGQFRAGEIGGSRVFGDIGNGIDSFIKGGAEDLLISAITKSMEAYDKAPKPVQQGVQQVGKGAQWVDNRLEDVSRATNTSRLITDEAVTLGAGKALSMGGRAVKGAVKAGTNNTLNAIQKVVTKPAAGTTTRPYRPAPQQIKQARRAGLIKDPKGGKNPTKFDYANNPNVGSGVPPSMRRSPAIADRQYAAQGNALVDGQFRSVGAAGAPSDPNSAAARFDAVAGPRIQGAARDRTDLLRARPQGRQGIPQSRVRNGAINNTDDYVDFVNNDPDFPRRRLLNDAAPGTGPRLDNRRILHAQPAQDYGHPLRIRSERRTLPVGAVRRSDVKRSRGSTPPNTGRVTLEEMRAAIADGPRRQQVLNDADAVVGSRMPGNNLNTPTDETARIRTSRQSRRGTVRRSDVRSGRNQPTPERPAGFTAGQERQAAKARQVRQRLNNMSPNERRRIIDRADPRLRQEGGSRLTQPSRNYTTADNNNYGLDDVITTPRTNRDRLIPRNRELTNRARRNRNSQATARREQREIDAEARRLERRRERYALRIADSQSQIAARNRLAGNQNRQDLSVDRIRRGSVGRQATSARMYWEQRRDATQRAVFERANGMQRDTIGLNNRSRRENALPERPRIQGPRSGTSRIRNGLRVKTKQYDKAVDYLKTAKRREQADKAKKATRQAISRQKGNEPTKVKSSLKAKQGPINPETGNRERLFTPENRAKALRKKGREVREYDVFDDKFDYEPGRAVQAGGKETYQINHEGDGKEFDQGFKSINDNFEYMSDAELKASGYPVRSKSKVDQKLNRANVGNQQGTILSEMKNGEIVTSVPIPGRTKMPDGSIKVDLQRAKLYKRQTKGALDYKVIDGDTGYAVVKTRKVGKNRWKTINGDVVEFDPKKLGEAIDKLADYETPRRLSGRRLKGGGGSRAKLKMSRK